MSNTTEQIIDKAIRESRTVVMDAVLRIIADYKRLQLAENPKTAYDLGARDSIDTLAIHLTNFAEGLKKGSAE